MTLLQIFKAENGYIVQEGPGVAVSRAAKTWVADTAEAAGELVCLLLNEPPPHDENHEHA